jgi:hypothetical protein
MNYERKKELTNEFKLATKDKKFMPLIDKEHGNKYAGKLTYLHFMFYAILRDKNIKDTAKNVESYKYRYRKEQLLSFIQNNNFQMEIINGYFSDSIDHSCHFLDIFKSLKNVFTTITIEETINIVQNYQHNKTLGE